LSIAASCEGSRRTDPQRRPGESRESGTQTRSPRTTRPDAAARTLLTHWAGHSFTHRNSTPASSKHSGWPAPPKHYYACLAPLTISRNAVPKASLPSSELSPLPTLPQGYSICLVFLNALRTRLLPTHSRASSVPIKADARDRIQKRRSQIDRSISASSRSRHTRSRASAPKAGVENPPSKREQNHATGHHKRPNSAIPRAARGQPQRYISGCRSTIKRNTSMVAEARAAPRMVSR